MKKFIFLIAIAIGSMVCTAARAQTTKEAYKQELRTYMESSGSTASFDTMVNQLHDGGRHSGRKESGNPHAGIRQVGRSDDSRVPEKYYTGGSERD